MSKHLISDQPPPGTPQSGPLSSGTPPPGPPPSNTRIVVAMSGGVDSSVVAGLLVEQGYEVIGITMQLYDHGQAIASKGACCAGADIHDARMVANQLNIPHYVLDYESRFRAQVIEDFADNYVSGLTPIPCVRCNQTVKFQDLLGMARDLGADCLATGHYVQRDLHEGHLVMRRGLDPDKDQSYFLFATTADQLAYLRFPLGSMTKVQTRALAKKYNLSIHAKPDSQDICFVPQGRYGDVVRKLRPGAIESGFIRHMDGTVLGRHNGVIDYTIGQRRGLGIGGRQGTATTPLYVISIDADAHEVIVGPRAALACRDVWLEDVNWITPSLLSGLLGDKDKASGDYPVRVKLRSTSPAIDAILGIDAGRVHLRLCSAEYGIAAGQAGVIYDRHDEDLVLGGGWISSAPLSKPPLSSDVH